MRKTLVLTVCMVALACALFRVARLEAQTDDNHTSATGGQSANVHEKMADEDTMRFEGEKRYSANCGRCHQPPHKLSPRMMATAVRHMRVRAMLSDEDMRYILWYMTR